MRLQREYRIVDDGLQDEAADPESFFRGSPPAWGDIAEHLDAPRDLEDQILEKVLVDAEIDRGRVDFFVVHAEAGAGKSTLLRRVGAELATTWDKVVLDLKPFGALDFLDIEALAGTLRERVYVLVDDVVRVSTELRTALAAARRTGLKLTVVGEARTNEWHDLQESTALPVRDEFEIGPLSRAEIDGVLDTLTKHDKLGYLTEATREQQQDAFESRAEKQLLVALREATEGRAFDEIVVDEYERIPSEDAQRAYLLVAALHRFNLYTRAAVLHRALGVPLAELGPRVFAPAEKILIAREAPKDPEPYYATRHPLIAEIVFDRMVHSEAERLTFYTSLISQLDLGYRSDAETYRRLSRSLNTRLLRDFEKGSSKREIMREITALDPSDAFVHQHAAMMELAQGDLRMASEHIAHAISLRPDDGAIRDTEGRILLASARREPDTVRRLAKLDQAAALFDRNITRRPEEPYGYRHLAEVYWEKYRADPDAHRGVEHLGLAYRTLTEGLEESGNASMLLQYRAELEDRVGSHGLARETLDEAIRERPTDVPLRIMAARLAQNAGRGDEATDLLRNGIQAAPDSWELHYRLALRLAEQEGFDKSEVRSHFAAALLAPLRRFRPRLAYAAWLFGVGEYEEAASQFSRLDELDLPAGQRREAHSYRFAGLARRFTGQVVRLSYKSGDVEFGRGATRVFFRVDDLDQSVRRWLTVGAVVSYDLAFNVRGPIARNVRRAQIISEP